LHDMCDKKYMNEEYGIADISEYLRSSGLMDENALTVIIQIVSTMSYSKIKKDGFPNLGEYQLAYHIVREADLLAAYALDRCTVFGMLVHGKSYTESVVRAKELYESRVMNYIKDGLFITEYSKKKAKILADSYLSDSEKYIEFWLLDYLQK